MKRKAAEEAAEGLAATHGMPPAANEEFTEMVPGLDWLARPRSGWDPYEVWRTRVKDSSSGLPGHERDPLY
jgi:hypothetical protein